MKKSCFLILLFIVTAVVSNNAQNIAVNTTGTAAAATNMFEVTQTSTTANTVGIYSAHSGAITGTGYGLYSTKTGASTTNIGGYFNASGATNNYGLIVPSGGGKVGIGTITPTGLFHVTQTATATGALTGIVYDGAVNTNQTASTEIPAVTLTTAGRQWATGALATQREVLITQPAYSFVGASTITDGANLAIAGAPISNTNTSLTNTHALLIQASSSTDGTGNAPTNSYGLTVNAQTGATNNHAAAFLNGRVGIGTSSPTGLLHVTQTATATGALTGIVYTGAVNTNQTASTEIPAVTLTTAGRQWATGALATQREVLITQPAYSFVGASTITDGANLAIAGAPISNTNTSLTNTHALLIQASSSTDGTGNAPTNSFGLTVNAQTGATNNYAAAFLGGNVGMGTNAPTANARLTLKDGHLETDQTTAPTVVDHANAGVGASASLAAGSTDVAGKITLVSGSSGWVAGVQVTLTFNKSFPTAPIVMWSAANDITGSSVKGWYSGSTTTTLTLSATDALSGVFSYEFYYFVIGI